MCLLGLTLLASLLGSTYGSLSTILDRCPELRAPNFGAISCNKWEMGTRCVISCRRGYDIPQSVRFVPTLYECQSSTGRWSNDHVPDCEWREYREKNRMESYYYFPGRCLTSREVIKSNFLAVIHENKACPSEKDCTMENVSVKCGEEPHDEWFLKRSLGYRGRGRGIFQRQSKNKSG